MQALAAEHEVMKTQVRTLARKASEADHDTADAPLAPWVIAALRLVGGSYQIAQSVAEVRALAAHQATPTVPTAAQPGVGEGGRSRPALPPLVPVFGNLHLHPTTILGIQAVLATGLAMLIARLLNVDHSNWVFWTAFVVIAGSTGESLRKMMLRVVGTVGGATIGVALALLTPDNTALVALVATGCIFLTIYFWPVSYPLMVFWLNIGFVLVYTLLGAQAMDILISAPGDHIARRLSGGVGGRFVLPIHTTDRFKAAVTRFLAAVDAYIATSVDAMTRREDARGDKSRALSAAHARVAATYAQVEQTLPAVAFENNPLLQAESPLARRGTQIAALEGEVARLAGAADERVALDGAAGDAAWQRGLQARIHSDIQALIALLSSEGHKDRTRAASKKQGTAAPVASPVWEVTNERLAGRLQAAGGPGQVQTSGELALIRIQGIVAELLAEVGAPARGVSV